VAESLFGGTSPTKVAVALDNVAATLEKDLEEERRERKEQVGFLNRICLKERELLIGRAEAFQRQLAEAQELWEKERVLFQDRLAASEAVAGAQPELRALRLELEGSKKESAHVRAEMKELKEELRVCQAQRDTAVSSFQEVQARQFSREAEATNRLRSEYAEQRQVFLEEASVEVAALRQQLQTLKQEKEQAAAELQKARQSEEELVATLRQESEEENQSALMRAIWQLQVADDCVVSLQGRLQEESETYSAFHCELLSCRQELTEEATSSRRLAAALSASEQEQELLEKKVNTLESSLRGDESRCSDMPETSRERQQALALIQRLRARQVGSLASLEDPLWPKTGSLASSPLRSSPHLRGASSFLSSLGLPTSPSKEISSSGGTALGFRSSQ